MGEDMIILQTFLLTKFDFAQTQCLPETQLKQFTMFTKKKLLNLFTLVIFHEAIHDHTYYIKFNKGNQSDCRKIQLTWKPLNSDDLIIFNFETDMKSLVLQGS